MKSRKTYTIYRAFNLLIFCLLIISVASCRKEEFMPVPEGEIVPSDRPTISLKEALNASSYTLFKAAWARSTMEAKLKAYGDRTPFTLLVPTDAAFIADGLTLEVINSTAPALLDSMLMYHTIASGVNPKELNGRLDNTITLSMVPNPALRVRTLEPGSGLSDPYFYRLYLKVQADGLYVNGKNVGNIAPVLAANGTLWPIDHVQHKPTKTILQALEADGRFGIYLEVIKTTADQWIELSEYNYERLWMPGLVVAEYRAPSPNLTFTSILAPTDQAFHNAGFADAAAVFAFNSTRGLPHMDYDTYTMVGMYASDSLLTLHRWSDLIYPMDKNGNTGRMNPTDFFSNDLNKDLLANYFLRATNNTYYVPPMIMPLEFGKNADGAVTIKAKGSTHPPAVVVDGDINTIMGPIHVVDHLIPMADFKF